MDCWYGQAYLSRMRNSCSNGCFKDVSFPFCEMRMRQLHGPDRTRPLPNTPELEMTIDLCERKKSPSWDVDEVMDRWKWMKPPPASQKAGNALVPIRRGRL
ncbi:unnamed protein product [Microthlaspi erraticum]|uniref:Uncharacterized protein n=1 Tax=Microthlaspi erraticum TaxID=1685480 RepID=A0A6D2HK29_9BRAS|nr:unnamed protein product [Microthlaspi erraticum]